MEVLHREQLGDVGRRLFFERGDLGQLTVLLGQLRRGGNLDLLGVSQRALGERGEPPQRLNLVAKQLHPDGAVFGRREDVEEATADGELASILDLV